MKQLVVTHFNKALELKGSHPMTYPKNSLAVLPSKLTGQVIEQKLSDTYFISQLVKSYTHGEPCGLLFTHLSQGIGDIIAFSSVLAFLHPRMVQIHVDPKFFPLFDWFMPRNFTLRAFHAPIVNDFTWSNHLTRYKTMRRLYIEQAANEAGAGNWYEAYFNRIGAAGEFFHYYGRPFLDDLLLEGREPENKLYYPSVVICHRSSCQIRSSSFADFYLPLKEAMPQAQAYVHQVNLTTEDLKFIEDTGADVVIIPNTGFSDFLDDLAAATLVISTDTAAIHFREGLQKPYLSPYGAFTTQSRTQHYRYGRSFNTQSDCPLQPCFTHEERGRHICPWVEQLKKEGREVSSDVAPCQSGENFRHQLYNELKTLNLTL